MYSLLANVLPIFPIPEHGPGLQHALQCALRSLIAFQVERSVWSGWTNFCFAHCRLLAQAGSCDQAIITTVSHSASIGPHEECCKQDYIVLGHPSGRRWYHFDHWNILLCCPSLFTYFTILLDGSFPVDQSPILCSLLCTLGRRMDMQAPSCVVCFVLASWVLRSKHISRVKAMP